MPTQNFSRMGRKTQRVLSFVADYGPVFHPSPSGPGSWTPGGGHYQMTTTLDEPVALTSGYRTGSGTPGFNSPRRPFLLKSLGMSLVKSEFSAEGYTRYWTVPPNVISGPGTAAYEDRTIWSVNIAQWGSLPDETLGWVSALRDKATNNLLKNLRNSSFNAAQALAERKQTANLFSSTATRVAKSIISLRKGNFVKAASELGVLPRKRARRRFNSQYAVDQAKAVGNGWLELQYGWKPLLSDVYGSMETLAKANNPQGNPNTVYRKVSGFARRHANPTKTTNTALPSGYSGISTLVQQSVQSVIVRVGVTYSVSSPALVSMASVGITNPLLLAWELLPYSFVIDWFLPIGNYLESLDAAAGLAFQDGYVSILRKYECKTEKFESFSYSQGARHTYTKTTESYKSVWFDRAALTGFPSAPAPRFKNPLSTSHVASALALLLQLKR